MSSSVSAETYDSFDALGRVLGSTQTTNTVQYPFSYTYNLAGGITTEKYPSGDVINTSYDAAGRINQVNKTGGPTYASGLTYTASGAVQSTTLGNRLIEQTIYNSRLQPVTIQLGTATSASSVLELDYSFNTAGQTDNNGNVLEQKIKIGSTLVADQTYSYDQVNRLQTASETSGGATSWSRTFSYDRFGNMWTPPALATGIGVNPATPQAVAAFDQSTNRLASPAVYDAAGNLTTDTKGNAYVYDANNLMTSCTVNGVQASYTYDGNGKRITKTVAGVTTLFVYNVMGQLAAEYGGPAPTTGGTSYLTTDHLGSTRVTTDSNGAVRSRDDYLPFGEEIGAVGTGRSGVTGYSSSTDIRQKFTSKQRDTESNLDFFEARYFSSQQGRFTSPDEFAGGPEEFDSLTHDSASAFYADIENPQSLNKYNYCYGNPLRYVDPDGHDPDDPQVKLQLPLPHPYGYQPGDDQRTSDRIKYEVTSEMCGKGDMDACDLILPWPSQFKDPMVPPSPPSDWDKAKAPEARKGKPNTTRKFPNRKRAKEAAEHPDGKGKKRPTPPKSDKKKRREYEEQQKYRYPETHPNSKHPEPHFHDRDKSKQRKNGHYTYPGMAYGPKDANKTHFGFGGARA